MPDGKRGTVRAAASRLKQMLTRTSPAPPPALDERLVREIRRPLHVDFLVASSYGSEMVSSGTVKLLYDPETVLEGKHILLVEDIIDSGRTLSRLYDLLSARKPRSLEICALLHKHIATELKVPARFVGFDAPNEFLVGYGLDHAENFRHIPFIASLQ